jgi:hypothetical protein
LGCSLDWLDCMKEKSDYMMVKWGCKMVK